MNHFIIFEYLNCSGKSASDNSGFSFYIIARNEVTAMSSPATVGSVPGIFTYRMEAGNGGNKKNKKIFLWTG